MISHLLERLDVRADGVVRDDEQLLWRRDTEVADGGGGGRGRWGQQRRPQPVRPEPPPALLLPVLAERGGADDDGLAHARRAARAAAEQRPQDREGGEALAKPHAVREDAAAVASLAPGDALEEVGRGGGGRRAAQAVVNELDALDLMRAELPREQPVHDHGPRPGLATVEHELAGSGLGDRRRLLLPRTTPADCRGRARRRRRRPRGGGGCWSRGGGGRDESLGGGFQARGGGRPRRDGLGDGGRRRARLGARVAERGLPAAEGEDVAARELSQLGHGAGRLHLTVLGVEHRFAVGNGDAAVRRAELLVARL